ncbi:MAG: hypothetical protein JWM78_2505 [Verrucomicrobiaceae bacterium]|nr:hypothetical protein [Verrucomicrobiaceae bacterium]
MVAFAKLRIVLTVFAAPAWLALSACSHTPSPEDIPAGASFITNILADDTKLFTYRQRGFGGPPRENEAGAPERGGERGPKTEQMQKMAERGVVAMLMQNHYCREGYMVLEQYEQQRSYIVRGECRDAASQADREKYSAH